MRDECIASPRSSDTLRNCYIKKKQNFVSSFQNTKMDQILAFYKSIIPLSYFHWNKNTWTIFWLFLIKTLTFNSIRCSSHSLKSHPQPQLRTQYKGIWDLHSIITTAIMTASAAVIRISTQYKGLQRKHNCDKKFKPFPINATNRLFNQLSLIFYQLVTLSQISNTVKENKNQNTVK